VYGLRRGARIDLRSSKGLAEKALAGRCVMAVSDAAVREIAKVLLTHVDQESLRKVVDDLLDIRGDKSFRDMIATLARELKAGF
jgi:hypothetical protein